MSSLNDVLMVSLEQHSDARGVLFEVYRQDRVLFEARQVYVSTSRPGAVRGNHFHKRKTESFCVISGTANLSLVDVKSGEYKVLRLDGTRPQLVAIPPGIGHAIVASGQSEMLLLIIVSEEYNPNDSDTIPFNSVRAISDE